MNTSNITNYKPKKFAELLSVTMNTDKEKIKKQIEGDETIAKGVQDGDSPD